MSFWSKIVDILQLNTPVHLLNRFFVRGTENGVVDLEGVTCNRWDGPTEKQNGEGGRTSAFTFAEYNRPKWSRGSDMPDTESS